MPRKRIRKISIRTALLKIFAKWLFLMNNDAVNEVNKMNNRRWSLNANKKLKQK